MPPKRNAAKTARNEGSNSDADYTDTEVNRTVVSSPNVTMSEEMLQKLVSSITRSQAESSRTLIESILTGYRGQHSHSSSPQPDTPGYPQRPGNFAKCTARFDGRSKNSDELEAFIDAIEVYRECTNVSEEHALRGLPMLLVGEAAVWWQGVKSSVTSWTGALQRLRGMFGVPRPAYKIFRDIFSAEQSDERADVFVNKVRALLSKLPYVVPEAMKLDIVYGLLDRRIRKRVPRDAVDGLEQLICKVRLVEESLAEVSSRVDNNNSASPVNPPTARCRSTAGGPEC
ncbi:activity-regulated cytoskeleton associated protein 2-like [Ostrinia furnacalis]|uniref:activity-regulated cytoskeleton associated protein 2-like n=1 Tax=Ostrinia furnacalis TaxID=93504 RepID=UPI00103981C3|nr:activity-regulated cytoskeleton associated protein 2-like [Ostrinia furnacalis]